ncbi:MAG: hypothetical protein HQL25_02380 [Candidatus Omnitrophica bacterium]|nr:hypothetical protein [Candidatus Omnitrophota bacterium]
MKEIKLPIIMDKTAPEKILSMDEYLEFVEFNLTHNFDKDAYAKWKTLMAVNVPFKFNELA